MIVMNMLCAWILMEASLVIVCKATRVVGE